MGLASLPTHRLRMLSISRAAHPERPNRQAVDPVLDQRANGLHRSAQPVDAGIHKRLNDRLNRTEFIPFAPSVLAEYARTIFQDVGALGPSSIRP
jgi:hypothetical protein